MIRILLVFIFSAIFCVSLFAAMAADEGLIEIYLNKMGISSNFSESEKSNMLIMEGTFQGSDDKSVTVELRRIHLHPSLKVSMKPALTAHLRTANPNILPIDSLINMQNIEEKINLSKSIFKGKIPSNIDTNYVFIFMANQNNLQLIGYFEQTKGANVELIGTGDIKTNKKK